MGNARSDLDIFLLNNKSVLESLNKVDYDFSEFKNGFKNINNFGCDIEYWDIDYIEELFEQINNIDFSNTNIRSLNLLDIEKSSLERSTSFIHRLLVSKCIKNEEAYNKLKSNLKVNNYYKLMVRLYINNVDNLFDDIIGNYEYEEYETAVMIARSALLKTLGAYLFSQRVSIDRDKWILMKLKGLSKANREASSIYMRGREILFTINNSDLMTNVEDILELNNEIIETIQGNLGGI
ncbi:hypothetical protein K6959_16070 [Bacillus aquiflavi]|uniref:hypothetical protein n=1 Tax=Bacillus aquiflavi TaxID=2672567 RepID=UPI001CA95521|nr:hypothetical protein [Bacillus aquiflavi]UAC48078.1 hypothetical protein K6959_16070 [Bacillus aquiflavi]